MKNKKRFGVGAKVHVTMPGIDAAVIQVDDERTVFGEYLHTVKTEYGERKELGCNLELIPAPMTNSAPETTPLAHDIHFHGDTSRINVNSTDNSTNSTSVTDNSLFIKMQETARTISNETERNDIVAQLGELENAQGSTSGFSQAYKNFIATAANNMTLFAPFLPALAQMLSSK